MPLRGLRIDGWLSLMTVDDHAVRCIGRSNFAFGARDRQRQCPPLCENVVKRFQHLSILVKQLPQSLAAAAPSELTTSNLDAY